MLRTQLVALFPVVAALSLVGCSGDDSGSPTITTTPAVAQATAATTVRSSISGSDEVAATPTTPTTPATPTTNAEPATAVSTSSAMSTTIDDEEILTLRADDDLPVFEREVLAQFDLAAPSNALPIVRFQPDGSLLVIDPNALVLSVFTTEGALRATLTLPTDNGWGIIDAAAGPDDIVYVLTGPAAGFVDSVGDPVMLRAFDASTSAIDGASSPALSTWQPEISCGGICRLRQEPAGLAIGASESSPAEAEIPWVDATGAPSGETFEPIRPQIESTLLEGPPVPMEWTTGCCLPISRSARWSTGSDSWRADLIGVDASDGGVVFASGEPDGGAGVLVGLSIGGPTSTFAWVDLLPGGEVQIHRFDDDMLAVTRTASGHRAVVRIDGALELVALD